MAQWSDDFWESQVNTVQGRAGKACRIHWHNHCKPSANHADWTEEEEASLTELAESYDERQVRLCIDCAWTAPDKRVH